MKGEEKAKIELSGPHPWCENTFVSSYYFVDSLREAHIIRIEADMEIQGYIAVWCDKPSRRTRTGELVPIMLYSGIDADLAAIDHLTLLQIDYPVDKCWISVMTSDEALRDRLERSGQALLPILSSSVRS